MGAIFHRLLISCLALTLLAAVPGRLAPCVGTGMHGVAAAEAADRCAAGAAACTDRQATCIDAVGCVSVPFVPPSPALLVVALAWTAPSYDPATRALSGISIEPELSPPIHTA